MGDSKELFALELPAWQGPMVTMRLVQLVAGKQWVHGDATTKPCYGPPHDLVARTPEMGRSSLGRSSHESEPFNIFLPFWQFTTAQGQAEPRSSQRVSGSQRDAINRGPTRSLASQCLGIRRTGRCITDGHHELSLWPVGRNPSYAKRKLSLRCT